MSTVTIGCKLPHGLIIELGGKSVELAGTNSSNVIGGHGITEGVDKSFFDKWLSQNKGAAAVRNGLIFAHEKANSAKAEAKEKEENKNGFEGIDPNRPAAGIEPTDEMKKKLKKGK